MAVSLRSISCCCRTTIFKTTKISFLSQKALVCMSHNKNNFYHIKNGQTNFFPIKFIHSDSNSDVPKNDLKTTPHSGIPEEFSLFLTNNCGLDQNKINQVYVKCPKLFDMDLTKLKANVQHISDIGLTLNNMRKMVFRSPQILFVPPEHISRISKILVEDLRFTSNEVNKLLVGSAEIFLGSVSELERKYDFLHFTMGYRDHVEIVKYNVMKFPMQHLKTRFEFLNRRRQYIVPDRHGNTKIENPTLEKLFYTNDNKFCEEIANCEKWEFDIFVQLFSEELKLETVLEEEEEIVKKKNTSITDFEDLSNDDDDKKSFADTLLKQL